jgi:hypothetical protein
MNVMRAVAYGPDAPQYIVDYDAAIRALANLKGSLASHGCYEEAFRVSEMLQQLDRARGQYFNRDPL